MRGRFNWMGAGVSVLAALAVTGCGSSSSSSSSSGPPASSADLQHAQAIVTQYSKPPAKISQTVALPSAPPKGKTLIYLNPASVPAGVRVGMGEKAAAAALGWNFSEINYDQANPATLLSGLQSALIKHPTAVSITGTDPSQIGQSTLAAYAKAKVPIVVSEVASVPSNPWLLGDPGGAATYAASGRAVGAWFVADSKGKGKAVFANVPAFSILGPWASGFTSEVKSLCSACSVKVVNVPQTAAIGGGEAGIVVAGLRQNPSYKYLIFDDGAFAGGINAALGSAGLQGIKIAGGDMQPEQAAELRASKQSAWTGLDNQAVGYSDVDDVVRWVMHAGGSSANDVVPTQILMPNTIGNVSNFDVPADSLRQFEALWHVSATG